MPKKSAAEPPGLHVIFPRGWASRPLRRPAAVILNRLTDTDDGSVTSIVSMRWGRNDAYCGRCPKSRCTLIEGMCVVAVDGHVELEEDFHLTFEPRSMRGRLHRQIIRT